MNALVKGAGLEPGESPWWYAEVRAASGARTDLECWWGEPPLPRVVIEAKLGALLSAGQIAAYIPDLIRRASAIRTRCREAVNRNRMLVVYCRYEVLQYACGIR